MAAFDEALRTAGDFGPYADLQAAYCLAALSDRPGQNARAGKAHDAAEARLTKIDALEHQVAARLKVGDNDGALKASDALLALSSIHQHLVREGLRTTAGLVV